MIFVLYWNLDSSELIWDKLEHFPDVLELSSLSEVCKTARSLQSYQRKGHILLIWMFVVLFKLYKGFCFTFLITPFLVHVFIYLSFYIYIFFFRTTLIIAKWYVFYLYKFRTLICVFAHAIYNVQVNLKFCKQQTLT